MKKQTPSTNFRFSFATLIGLGQKTVSVMDRDQSELLFYGIAAADRTIVAQATLNLQDMPTDDEYKGIVIGHTATKDQLTDQIKVGIRSVMVRVADVFGEKSGTYYRFGTTGLSKMNDLDLLQCCKRVTRMAGSYISQLETKGLTPVMLETITQLATQFEAALEAKKDAELEREVATEQRITEANELYALITRVCGFGKDYWYTRNEAKYNDYVIYDTPSGNAENNTPPVMPA